MRYRKKLLIVEATQFLGSVQIPGICDCVYILGDDGPISMHGGSPHIHTLEGTVSINLGDWVITGINGEKYPCKPDIFEKTYEPFNE